MTDQHDKERAQREEELEREELEGQEGEELPDREAMSVIDMPGGGLGPPVE